MAQSYDLSQEFVEQGHDTSVISTSPYWILAVFPYKYPFSFDRNALIRGNSTVSFTTNTSNVDEVKDTVILTSSGAVTSMTISQSKAGFAGSLSAVVVDPSQNVLASIMPGDFCMAWIVNGKDRYEDLLARIKQGKPANKFGDGLKFIGKLNAPRKVINQSPNGTRTVQYQIQAVGFREFDFSVYFDPQLHLQNPSYSQFLARLGTSVQALYKEATSEATQTNNGGITTNRAIPFFLKILMGTGIPPNASDPSGQLPVASGGLTSQTSEDSPPFVMAIPKIVGKLLNRYKDDSGKKKLSYIDILDMHIGLQQYNGVKQDKPYSMFLPSNQASKDGNIRNYGDLLGLFLPNQDHFSGKNIWTIIGEYVNHAVNEMYVAIKTDESGNVIPTLTIRQIPFSSEAMAKSKSGKITSFLSLPRWTCPPSMIRSLDYGRSEALRFNEVQIYGGSPAGGAASSLTAQKTNNPPRVDIYDIARHGIKMYQQTVTCAPTDVTKGPGEWMEIAGDWLFDGQFRFTGSCLIQGVAAPISVGDNFEVDDIVFHIESVTHSVAMQNGHKSFTTGVALTHGIMNKQGYTNSATLGKSDLPSIEQGQNRNFDPGYTIESEEKK